MASAAASASSAAARGGSARHWWTSASFSGSTSGPTAPLVPLRWYSFARSSARRSQKATWASATPTVQPPPTSRPRSASLRFSSAARRARSRSLAASCDRSTGMGVLLLRVEGVEHVRVGQRLGTVETVRLATVVLLVERAALGLRVEVGGQVLAGDDGLEVVGQQDRLGAVAAGVVVHDPALPALVDEVLVARVERRVRRRHAPHLEVDAEQQVRVAAVRERHLEGDRVREGAQEVDRLAAERVDRDALDER